MGHRVEQAPPVIGGGGEQGGGRHRNRPVHDIGT
jgi:hypothetical protein